ncbi:MAG: hypothetical protein GC185_08910 [Alphaproteobacteria bacterium]|nr:hypothetical protein [Alphaproteobacteria bacterium]
MSLFGTRLRKAFNTTALGLVLATSGMLTAGVTSLRNAEAAEADTSQVELMTPPQTPAHTYVLKPVAISAFTSIFSTDDEKERNIFFRNSRQAVHEFKMLTHAEKMTSWLTKPEQKEIRDIRHAAGPDVKKYRIPLSVAETLRFASSQVGVDHDAFMNRLSQTAGNLAGADPAGLYRTDVFKFNVPTWLYLVKTYGPAHGLGYFADKITAAPAADGSTLAYVKDAAMLRQIADMRHNPRISALMGAEYIKNEANLPPAIAYRGITFKPDAVTARRQTYLMTLGFDLGVRAADGNRGPLTDAAMVEFAHISGPLLQKDAANFDQLLQDAALQAQADSTAYSTDKRPISPATAFAVRHAAKIVGVDFAYLMELAGAESGFDETAEAATSSASGLFQFTDQSWLMMLSSNGAKYGLNDLTAQIRVTQDKEGHDVYRIDDPLVQRYALSLRADPRICALMGAEYAKDNEQALKAALPHTKITRTDQYLAHFLGSGSATRFIAHMSRSPGQAGSALFASAAKSNKSIFYKDNGAARSLKEIYKIFSHKFDTGLFDKTPLARVPLPRPRPAGLGLN